MQNLCERARLSHSRFNFYPTLGFNQSLLIDVGAATWTACQFGEYEVEHPGPVHDIGQDPTEGQLGPMRTTALTRFEQTESSLKPSRDNLAMKRSYWC